MTLDCGVPGRCEDGGLSGLHGSAQWTQCTVNAGHVGALVRRLCVDTHLVMAMLALNVHVLSGGVVSFQAPMAMVSTFDGAGCHGNAQTYLVMVPEGLQHGARVASAHAQCTHADGTMLGFWVPQLLAWLYSADAARTYCNKTKHTPCHSYSRMNMCLHHARCHQQTYCRCTAS